MPPTSDVRPTSHDRHDPLLVAALAAGDLAATDRVHAVHLIETCRECATLHDDLVAIARATATVPPPITTRPRDFRLSREQARRLRPTGWRRFVGAFADPQLAFTKPLGVGLATIGLAGLLLGNVTLGFLGGAMSAAAPGLPVPAGGTSESNQSGTRALGDNAAASSAPAASAPAASGAGGFYPATLPSSSAAASSVPAALGVSPAPSGSSDQIRGSYGGPPEVAGGPKTTTPGASQPPRDVLAATESPTELGTGPDLRTLIFVAAVLVGLGLLVLRRVARRVTAA